VEGDREFDFSSLIGHLPDLRTQPAVDTVIRFAAIFRPVVIISIEFIT